MPACPHSLSGTASRDLAFPAAAPISGRGRGSWRRAPAASGPPWPPRRACARSFSYACACNREQRRLCMNACAFREN
eukprot:2037204-Pyramimonas_sp.AAC.1